MSLSYAVLVDGGFLKRKLYRSGKHPTAVDIGEFLDWLCAHEPMKGMRLHRIYFYDALPLMEKVNKPLEGGEIDFSSTAAATNNRSLHAELKRRDFTAMRLGELAMHGWRLKATKLRTAGKALTVTHEDLEPAIQQKGVDMRIGMDIAALVLKRLVSAIVLVTGDSDLVPAMKFARREGAQLFLATLGHGVKDSMNEHCDLLLRGVYPPKSLKKS